MSRGMVSFLAGFGGGYLKAKDKEYERARQEKEDAWRDEQRGWQKADRAEKEADKVAIRDATADRTTMQGTAVTDGAGNANLYKDPTQAAAMADEARIEAEMRGQSPATVMTAPATGVTGNMSKGHQIASGPVDVEALNSRDAQVSRISQALMQRGKPMEALSMENAVIDNKAKSLGLKTEELKFADQMFNRKLDEKLSETPNWYEGGAKILTETNVGGLAGVTIRPVLSEDGKTVNMTATGPDGTEKVVKSFSAGPEGRKEFSQALAKVDVGTRIGWMAEQAKTAYQQGRDVKADEAAAARAALEDRRTTVAERNAANNERKTDAILMRGMGSAGGGGGGGGAAAPGGMPDPMAGFDSKKAFAAATDQAIAELSQNPATPATPQAIAQRSAAIVRAMEDEFRVTGVRQIVTQAFERTAATAKTPEELASVFQRGVAAGLAPQEMAALDPRFAALAQKTAPAAQQGAATTKTDTTKTAPPASPPPAPTMEQIQAQTRQNRERIAKQAEIAKNAERDPDVQALKQRQTAAIRAGKPMEANAIAQQINQVKAQRYGVQ